MTRVAEYRGLRAIAKRLQVHRSTVIAWIHRDGLLCYRRRVGPRTIWVTSDELIFAWQVAKCRSDRSELLRTTRRVDLSKRR